LEGSITTAADAGRLRTPRTCVFSKWPMPASMSLIMRQDSLPCTLDTSAARLMGGGGGGGQHR
jgi:hypothetical protein